MKLLNRILLFGILYCTQAVHAQQRQYTFSNVDEKNGLIDNIIFCLLKDHQGILWVGTQNGLSRFDGSHFYNYKRKRDHLSLPDNSIQSLCEDQKGNIWGGTDNGIFCYTPQFNRFEHFNPPGDGKGKVVCNIVCDKDNNIFATTPSALNLYNRSTKLFEQIVKFNPINDSFNAFYITKNRLLYDKQNNGLWLSLPDGLHYYDISSKKILDNRNMPDNDLFSLQKTAAITQAPDGSIWFYVNLKNELISFNPVKKKIISKISLKGTSSVSGVSSLLVDENKRIWVSTWPNHVYCIYTKDSIHIEQVSSIDGLSTSIASQFFWDAFSDENGSIWLGTPNGISIYNDDKQVYKACRLPDKIPELKSRIIFLVKENPKDKSWWLSTTKNELIHYFPYSGKYKMYALDSATVNKNGNKPGKFFDLFFLDEGVLLITGFGAWQLAPNSNAFVPSNLLPKEFGDMDITQFLETDSLYCFGHGRKLILVNKFNKHTQLIELDSTYNGLPNSSIFYHVVWRPNQALCWSMGSNYILKQGKDHKIEVTNLIKDSVAGASGIIKSTSMDKDGNVWIVNAGIGLYCYNSKTNLVNYWNDLDGMANPHVHAVMADDIGNVWCTYYNKVTVYNSKKKSFANFTIPDAENKSIYINTLERRSDGVLMGNVFNDIYEFHPENLYASPVLKAPVFSSISVAGIDRFVSFEEELQLKPDENSIRIKFGLLVDPSIYAHHFEYILEGADKKWMLSSMSNEANYTNLDPGNYIFRVIAIGENNSWKTKEGIIKFTIATPYYKTNWFIGLLLFLAASIIFLLYRYRLQQQARYYQLESTAQRLEKEKTMVMYDSLKQQLNPHFLFNSLTSLSGLIQIDQEMAGDFLEQMSGIYRYILKNGERETVFLRDEIEFVKLYINLQQTRFKKGLQIHIDIAEEFWDFKIAPVTLQNMIENAIKHNILDSESPLIIDIFIETDYLVVKNNVQKKNKVESSNKTGLIQFKRLYQYLIDKPILIEENNTNFIIKIPLI